MSRGRWKVERLRRSSDTGCLSVRDKETGEETIEVSASYLYSFSRPHIIGVCGHYHHGRSTWGMPEILLEARSDVCFELETELARGENENTPSGLHTGPHRCVEKTGTNLRQKPRAREGQGAAGETPGVQEFVERAGDVKCRLGCSAIETGLKGLSGYPGCFAALRPRQISSLCLFPSDDVRCLARTRYVFRESEVSLQSHLEDRILLTSASDSRHDSRCRFRRSSSRVVMRAKPDKLLAWRCHRVTVCSLILSLLFFGTADLYSNFGVIASLRSPRLRMVPSACRLPMTSGH